MFCSESCFSSAFERYHRYECSIMSQLLKSGSVHMCLRIFFIALSTFNDSIEELKNFIDENKTTQMTVFDIDFRSPAEENNKKHLLALLSLTKSSKAFPLQLHQEVLKSHKTLNEMWKNHQEFIKSFLLKNCQISDFNFHGIFSGSSQKLINQNPAMIFNSMQQSVGSGSMPFSSLINHSCNNNVVRVCVEGKIAFVVCRPISKGSQLFDCYKYVFNFSFCFIIYFIFKSTLHEEQET